MKNNNINMLYYVKILSKVKFISNFSFLEEDKINFLLHANLK